MVQFHRFVLQHCYSLHSLHLLSHTVAITSQLLKCQIHSCEKIPDHTCKDWCICGRYTAQPQKFFMHLQFFIHLANDQGDLLSVRGICSFICHHSHKRDLWSSAVVSHSTWMLIMLMISFCMSGFAYTFFLCSHSAKLDLSAAFL